jgi:hypothetical protein
LLCFLATGAFCFIGLAISVPWAAIVFFRYPWARTFRNSAVLILGLLTMTLLSLWLGQFIYR